jgi:hypothetical protein
MSDYITKFTMKHEYNMTDALIKKLGEPDKVVRNPHYSKAAPMQLYLRERVAKWVEENPDLIQKVIERRTKKPLKPPDPIPEPPPPREVVHVPAYRKSIRRMGDKWSWGVYQTSKNMVIKTGWADSEVDAQAKCSEAISAYQLTEVREYRNQNYRERYPFDDFDDADTNEDFEDIS